MVFGLGIFSHQCCRQVLLVVAVDVSAAMVAVALAVLVAVD